MQSGSFAEHIRQLLYVEGHNIRQKNQCHYVVSIHCSQCSLGG